MSGGRGTLIVTAALLERDGRLLACRRPPGGRQAGMWEFPGGGVEPGEDPREGLRRELREELGIETEICEPYEIVFHRYEFGDVLLLFFRATLTAGNPEALHHAEIRWVKPSELAELEFLPADRELIERLAGGSR